MVSQKRDKVCIGIADLQVLDIYIVILLEKRMGCDDEDTLKYV